MKILILGGTGMLGHKILQIMSAHHSVIGTVRNNSRDYQRHPVLKDIPLVGNIRADDFPKVSSCINKNEPDVIVNCIGIVKQLPEAQDPLKSIMINALFPHQLATICQQNNIRLIHFSTDCVFSGRRGNYFEDDISDAEDLYGRSKFLGEVNYPGCLTIRTSIIGRELKGNHGLLEWFLSQKGNKVFGYKNALFSGVTTITLSKIIDKIVSENLKISGIYHVSSDPISKYDLLSLVNKVYKAGISIEPEYATINNRILIGKKFKTYTHIKIPSWRHMINEMYLDETTYI